MLPEIRRKTARKMHKYVFGLLAVWLTFVVSAGIAAKRVSQSEKFAPYQLYLKSFTLSGKTQPAPIK
ncbi:hypothetical protein [Gloeothece verrucosa]|uniref:Uncharacterized protein n=1 Tax=Gloeothece verrucosa (strain PCC 7822) TaxID=497965 RepID=E0UEF2_GLOV7|nr:hypothetical protein [Gloeothece verrucosa]ADN15398.1 hypothetical protein Cyan7822_3451 [Gloeothece verrucosa PCC 7822]